MPRSSNLGLSLFPLRHVKTGVPTPIFNFRLPENEANDLRRVAKLYGAPSTSAFLREMLMVFCSGEPDQARSFVGRLFSRLGEQLTLPLNAPPVPRKQAKKRKRGRRGGSPP